MSVEIYFVRHGETGGNIAKRHQQEDTHLSQCGRKQAQKVAKKIAKIKPTHLYVSTRVRTLETGQEIAKTTGLIPETSQIFVELKRPDYMYGHFHRSLKTGWYLFSWLRGKVGVEDLGEEGESYSYFRSRLNEAKNFLESHKTGDRIVVVSHTVFITLFVAHLKKDRALNIFEAVYVYFKIKSLKNCSVTKLTFDGKDWYK